MNSGIKYRTMRATGEDEVNRLSPLTNWYDYYPNPHWSPVNPPLPYYTVPEIPEKTSPILLQSSIDNFLFSSTELLNTSAPTPVILKAYTFSETEDLLKRLSLAWRSTLEDPHEFICKMFPSLLPCVKAKRRSTPKLDTSWALSLDYRLHPFTMPLTSVE